MYRANPPSAFATVKPLCHDATQTVKSIWPVIAYIELPKWAKLSELLMLFGSLLATTNPIVSVCALARDSNAASRRSLAAEDHAPATNLQLAPLRIRSIGSHSSCARTALRGAGGVKCCYSSSFRGGRSASVLGPVHLKFRNSPQRLDMMNTGKQLFEN